MKIKIGYQINVGEDGRLETNSIYQEIKFKDVIGPILTIIGGISLISFGIWYLMF